MRSKSILFDYTLALPGVTKGENLAQYMIKDTSMKGMYRQSRKRTLIGVQRLGQTRATSLDNVRRKSYTYYEFNKLMTRRARRD